MSHSSASSALPQQHHVSPEQMRKIAVASVIGTTVEWYDLFLFATASALVFNKAFFPNFDPLVGTMLAFGTFAAAYVARIVGAILFGHFGDRLGRKSMLLISLIGMGAATFCIGLLPGYDAWGAAAPFLLLTLRIIQGLALGGEWGGAVLMTVEHAPADRRGFFGSLVQLGVPVGTLIANLVFLAMAANLSEDALVAWGWRVPFLASIILIAIGFYIRLRLEETPAFQRVREEGAEAKIPFATLMQRYWKQVVLGGFATLSTGSSFNILVGSGLNYGKQQGLTNTQMLIAVMVACFVGALLLPLFGAWSDRIGRRPIILAGIVAEMVAGFALIWLMDHGSMALTILGYVIMIVAFAANYGPIATFLAEQFGAKVRYSGLSVAYMLSGLLGSATTAPVTTWLLGVTHSGYAFSWFMLGTAALSLIALLMLSETSRSDINAVHEAPAEGTD
ncbi:MFS transporter [Nigerium massiliense]|uniref:MFS transporter n=1 Tax=Nigerium massiliense TaxID=1522317 RepID=UPI0005916D81|nr:MFS transporter [Nigerium massiliense]